MYCLHKTTSAVSCVKPNASQWEATLRDDVGFATVYCRIYRRKFLTLSNQTSRYIRECIRILFLHKIVYCGTYLNCAYNTFYFFTFQPWGSWRDILLFSCLTFCHTFLNNLKKFGLMIPHPPSHPHVCGGRAILFSLCLSIHMSVTFWSLLGQGWGEEEGI